MTQPDTLAPKAPRKPTIRVVFSDFNDAKDLYLPNPWLSLTLTIEFRMNDRAIPEFFFRLTLPGCMWSPYQLGSDKEFGYFKPPVPFHKSGPQVSGPKLEPSGIITTIEVALRAQERVKLWTMKANRHYKELGINPHDKTQLKTLKRNLRSMKSRSR